MQIVQYIANIRPTRLKIFQKNIKMKIKLTDPEISKRTTESTFVAVPVVVEVDFVVHTTHNHLNIKNHIYTFTHNFTKLCI